MRKSELRRTLRTAIRSLGDALQERDEARAEVDRLQAQVAALTSALERTEANFRAAVRGLPVRDMAENLAENRAALASGDEVQP